MEWWLGPSTRNVKAEAFGDAHKQRVESEVSAWLMSEVRKAEARAATAEIEVVRAFGESEGPPWKLSAIWDMPI
ncbi:hypothetical protein M758_UG116600 [Ceratodon purpureus]|nr:hypothetical protein M758_UG116600 [Ceratodon purpureus]